MGLNIGSLNSNNFAKPAIDTQALAKVTEQIFNPSAAEKTVDVSTLDLSKFNRVKLGTDLYAERTNGDLALKAAKAATDFGLNFSKEFNANIQYLNSQAAQGLFTSKENNGKVAVGIDNVNDVKESKVVIAASQVNEMNQMDKDKKGSNPFAFYMPSEQATEEKVVENIFIEKNIFA